MPTPIECTTYHLQGERLKQKIGEIVLKGGDVLLLDTGVFVSCNLYFWCTSLAAVYELDLLFTSNPQALIFWKTTGKTRPLLS